MTNEQIRNILLENGFAIKPGCKDLEPYVYNAIHALLEEQEGIANFHIASFCNMYAEGYNHGLRGDDPHGKYNLDGPYRLGYEKGNENKSTFFYALKAMREIFTLIEQNDNIDADQIEEILINNGFSRD